jgi:hypothetical protein
MILADFATLLFIALPLSLFGQWWILRRRWLSRVLAAQARHARYQARAQVTISLTRQRIHNLQAQLSARPKVLRPVAPVALHPVPDDAELIVVDEDGGSAGWPLFRSNMPAPLVLQ